MTKNLSEKERLQRAEMKIHEHYHNKTWENQAFRDHNKQMLGKRCIFGVAMMVLFFVGVGMIKNVTTDLDFECSSGDIDMDINAHYDTQGYPCNISTAQPGTCFNQTLLGDTLKFTGIDGLTCRGRVSVKAPVWLMMGAIFS